MLVLDMARFGDHRHGIPSDAAVAGIEEWFTRNGYEFGTLISTLRDPTRRVPLVESLIGSDWRAGTTEGTAGSWSVVDGETGETLSTLAAAGVLSLSTYRSQFDQAVRSLERAIEQSSYQEFLQAAATGIASLDTFMDERVRKWNATNVAHAIHDKRPFTTFEQKVASWFPQMAKGAVYDRGGPDWYKLKCLRLIRDEGIHAKKHAQAITFGELADYSNWFADGLATTLFKMHLYFGLRIPSSIIRARHAPRVIES